MPPHADVLQWEHLPFPRFYPFNAFRSLLGIGTNGEGPIGCRHFTLAQAQKHWEKTRAGTALFKETENIVRSMVELARIRKLMP